jgi:D-arabinose 1-dehydrogenase-like Zn-dependent alcohol dehydrogenase
VFIFEAPLVRSVERTANRVAALPSYPEFAGHEFVGYIADVPTGGAEFDHGRNDVEYPGL